MEGKTRNRFPVENTVTFSAAARKEAKELLWDLNKNLPKFIQDAVDYYKLKTQICAVLMWIFKGGKPLCGTNENTFDAYKKVNLIHLSNVLYECFDKWNTEKFL